MSVKETFKIIGAGLYGCGLSQAVALPGALIAHCEEKRHTRAITALSVKISNLAVNDPSLDNLRQQKISHEDQVEKCNYIKSAFISGLSIPILGGVLFAAAISEKGKGMPPMRSFKFMAASWYGCGLSQIAAIPGALFSAIIGLGHNAHSCILTRKAHGVITPEAQKQQVYAARCFKISKLFFIGLIPFVGGMGFAAEVMRMNDNPKYTV